LYARRALTVKHGEARAAVGEANRVAVHASDAAERSANLEFLRMMFMIHAKRTVRETSLIRRVESLMPTSELSR
jgi:hypothetical protein